MTDDDTFSFPPKLNAILALHLADKSAATGLEVAEIHVSAEELPEEDLAALNAYLGQELGLGCKIIGYDGCGGSRDCPPVGGRNMQKVWLSAECPKEYLCNDCG